MTAPTAVAEDRPALGGPGRFALFCFLIYLSIYCLESPARYVLYVVHASSLILARDALIDIPILVLLVTQVLRRKLHWAFILFFLMLAIQGPVFIANFGANGYFPMIFGVKLIVNIVLGLMIGHMLLLPGRRTFWLLSAILIISVTGLVAEKLGGNFPWVGLHDTIGGTDIVLSRDWSVDDPVLRRVGGFFRYSIAAAMAVPLIGIAVACTVRSRVLRYATLTVSFLAVLLTTQKGAILGYFLIVGAMFMPLRLRLVALRGLVVIGAFFNATIPFFTNGMDISASGHSVASASSFAERIQSTWPNSWKWVSDHSIFPFGVGIGGMGVPLRQIAPTAFMFPDNMFIFVYAYFGIFAVLFYFTFIYLAWRSFSLTAKESEPALASLAFILLYGIVLSMLEDQIASFYLGASVGLLVSAKSVRNQNIGKLPQTPSYRTASAAAPLRL